MILYFDDSAFLTISRIVQKMETNISEKNIAKYYMHQNTWQFQDSTSTCL